MYFPPWVPVAIVILVVFGILGGLFFVRGAAGAPRQGDHWHATYQTFICGKRQPNFPFWEAGVHTHQDGIIHIHPFLPAEEGSGARLVKWFEYGGGKLTGSEMRMPGTRETYKNGETCPDGTPAVLQVFVNGQRLPDFSRFIPHDGDRVRIVFDKEEAAPVQQADRTIIQEDQATRTVEVAVGGSEASTVFTPASIEVNAGETVKLQVKNNGTESHGVRVAGADGQYETSDDYVSNPEIFAPGEQGVVVVRFDLPGEVEFRDLTVVQATGKLVVKEAQATPEATAEASPQPEAVDVTLDVSMGDNFFQPTELTVGAGQSFRINLKNDGKFVHNLRIVGSDLAYDTDDDLASTTDLRSGESSELVGKIDQPGTYSFRCDFHPIEMTGTLAVQ